jgi:hypothetical protein
MILLLLILLFPSFAFADWLVVPQSVTKDLGGTTHIRPDLTPLPIPVARLNGVTLDPSDCPPILNPRCFLIQVNEDFSKLTPANKALWYKPNVKEVNNWLAHKNISPINVRSVPSASLLPRLWRYAWDLIQPALAWALSCPGGSACDDFERTDSLPLNGSWTLHGFPTLDPNFPLLGDRIVYFSTHWSYAETTAIKFNPDQEAQTVNAVNGGCTPTNNCYHGPAVRINANGFYVALVDPDDHYSEIDIFDITGAICGTAYCTQTIASDNVTVWVNGDVLKLKIVGGDLTGYQNGSLTMTPLAADFSFATGQPGIAGYDGYTNFSQGVDDFIASNVTSGAVVRRRAPVVIQ